jgi:hypothetical protein
MRKKSPRGSRVFPRAVLGAAAAAIGGLYATTAPAAGAVGAAAVAASCCNVVELRQYTLHPQRFDNFTALFEREFIEPQEAAGITVIGQFRDLDDPNRFVWLRGFPDMDARARALETFYGGALWKSLREEANASFVDTDNVLLLRPATAAGAIDLRGLERTPRGALVASPGLIVAAVYPVDRADADEFKRWFERDMKPALAQAGIEVSGWFETEPAPNNFPRLPVRDGEHVLVWLARFAERKSGDAALRELTRSPLWRDTLGPGLRRRLVGTPQLLRLEPTARSLLR